MILRSLSFLFLGLLFSILGSGCSGSKIDSIREVAHKYLASRLKGDFKTAEKFVTHTSHELLTELEDLSQEYSEQSPTDIPYYTIVRVDDRGSSATVFYSLEGYGEESLLLTREQGQWRVVLNLLSVPDAGLLMMELHGLEMENSAEIDKEALDALLLQEELDGEAIDITEI